MRKKYSLVISVLVVVIFCFGCSSLHKEMSLAEINNAGVTGMLGPKLGTVVIVAGTVEENTSQSKGDEGEPFFLSIDSVNGNQLKSPVKYPLRTAHEWIKIETPKIGDHFNYVGYETGGFEGSPDGEFKYAPAYSTTGYFFNTSFLIIANGKK